MFGIAGYLFNKADIPIAPLVLGLVLGDLLEQSFRQSLTLSDGSLAIFVSQSGETKDVLNSLQSAEKSGMTSLGLANVIGSTLTTLAAFSPMLFWPGIMGEFMGYLPLTLIVTLSSSLFVAMVINPALASLFMKVKSKGQRNEMSIEEIAEAGEKPVKIRGFALTGYSRVLKFALQRPIAIIMIAGCFLILFFQGWNGSRGRYRTRAIGVAPSLISSRPSLPSFFTF